jgi:hypothetical protein
MATTTEVDPAPLAQRGFDYTWLKILKCMRVKKFTTAQKFQRTRAHEAVTQLSQKLAASAIQAA